MPPDGSVSAPQAAARQAIALLSLAGFIAGIALRCVEPMLPKLADEFGASLSAASVVITAFAVGYAGAILVHGALADRYGKLRVCTIALALGAAAALGCALAWDLTSLAVMRFLTASFSSASVGLGIAYIGDVAPVEGRQATIARFIAGSILGQTLGPFVGGIFTDWVGWRFSFAAVAAGFALVAAVLWTNTRTQWPGRAAPQPNPFAQYAGLLRIAQVRWVLGSVLLETTLFFGAFTFVGALLKARFDLSYTLIGLALAGFGAGGLLYISAVTTIIRRLGTGGMVATAGVLGGACFLAIALAPHWAIAFPAAFGLGLSFYMMHNTLQLPATEMAPHARGSSIAMFAWAWSFGQAIGVAAMGIGIAALGTAPMIAAFGLGYAALGLWLRPNLWRLQHRR